MYTLIFYLYLYNFIIILIILIFDKTHVPGTYYTVVTNRYFDYNTTVFIL